MKKTNNPKDRKTSASWLDVSKMDGIASYKIAAALLLSSDRIIRGIVYLLFVNLFSFELMVATFPFTYVFTGIFVPVYALMFLIGYSILFYLDRKYQFIGNRKALISFLIP